MNKIMVVTNLHPVALTDIMSQMGTVIGERTLVISPQAVSLMLEETHKIRYIDSFYVAINTVQKQLNGFANCGQYDNIIVFGTLDKKWNRWFDAVIGYEEVYEDGQPTFLTYKDFNEDFNNEKINVMTFEDVDYKTTDMRELIHFIKTIMKRGEKKNDSTGEK